MNYANLIQNITENIKTNGSQAITAQVLQDVLVDMVGELGQSGALLGGVIDTSFVPDSTNDAQVVYIAESPGTYTNFNGLVVGAGEVAFFYFDGNAWAKSSVDVLEVVNNLNSTATDKALSAAMGKQLQDALTQAVSDLNTAIGGKADTSYVNTQLATKADKTYVDNQLATKADSSQVAADLADKIDKVHDAEVGNVPMFKADGGIEDGGVAADNIAEQDGYYETMVVGAAENLIGRGTVPANYTRRRSGGGSIGSGAEVMEEIQGNTLVFNQLAQNGDFADGTTNWSAESGRTLSVTDGVATIEITSNPTGNNGILQQNSSFGAVSGHKYYVAYSAKINTQGSAIRAKGQIVSMGASATVNVLTSSWVRYSEILTAISSPVLFKPNIVVLDTVTGGKADVKNFICIDLTQMGLDSLTAAEFEAMFPLNYYAYNTGSLLNLTATGLQTNGFNQWDEEWESGNFNATTGADVPSTTTRRSKNYIPVFGGQAYYFYSEHLVGVSGNQFIVGAWDAEKNYIGLLGQNWQNTVHTLPANCAYVRFYGLNATFDKHICINFSDTARNGEYEPYWSETHALPITTATSGGSVIFADGIKSVPTAHDRFYKSAGSEHFDKAEKVILKVDMGTLAWGYSGTYFSVSAVGLNMKQAGVAEIFYKNVKYTCIAANQTFTDKELMASGTYNYIRIKDTAYTDSAVFRAAMSGVWLYYEAQTPTDYTLDTPFSAQYKVDGMGTETLLPQNTATPTTSPINAEVKYPMNAVDTLRNLPQNYISKASMDAILTAFKTAGVITNYTLTWDATNQKYNCTITP